MDVSDFVFFPVGREVKGGTVGLLCDMFLIAGTHQ